MSTGTTEVTRRGVFPRLRDARIRVKLAAILVVPLVAVVALAGVRLIDIGRRASTVAQVEKLAALQTDISALAQSLHVERMAGAAYLALPGSAADAYQAAIKQSDALSQLYFAHRRALGDPPTMVQERLNRIDDHLLTMDTTRTKIAGRDGVAVAEAVARYSVVITDLLAYGEVVSQVAGSGTVANALRAVSSFGKAKAGAAEQEAIAYAARAAGDSSIEQRTSFIATQTGQQDALLTFALAATPAQQSLVDKLVTGDPINAAERVSSQFNRGVAVSLTDITQSLGAVVDLMRQTEQQLEVQLEQEVRADRDAVLRQAAIEAGLVLLVLIVAIALAVMLARSLHLSLRELRESALSVANRDLPDAVARLRDVGNLGEGGADDIVRQVRDPIRMGSRDEIGQVAQAFNVVHREAVRIAAEQAALRTSVSAMFLNLARRSQSLVDRMIGELDTIERTEEDPKRLARLFELDHLATRMRRNDENLLILAGADSSAPRRENALLVDALRAAQSEVELYNRVEFGTVDTDIWVVAGAVNDVVRLLAELLDNATRFSPPTTVVVADARHIRDHVLIQVEDRGLGMSQEQMDVLNQRLSEPPTVDVAAFRMMGLAVVGRLAARYGIQVELRPNPEGGTVAQVMLPGSVVVLPSRRAEPVRAGRAPELTGPSEGWPGSSRRAAVATLPALTAAPMPEPDRGLHPRLPTFPSQRPPVDPTIGPTPNRPPLPTRAARPVTAESAPNGFTSPGEPNRTVTPPQPAGFGMSPVTPPVNPGPGGWGAALAAMPPPVLSSPAASANERTDAPIYVEMQQSWFTNHDSKAGEEWGMPTAGYAPPPNSPAAGPKPGPAIARAVVRAPAAARPGAAPSTAGPSPRTPQGSTPASSVPGPAAAPSAPAPAPSAPTPARRPGSSGAPAPAGTTGGGSIPRPRPAVEDRWRTAADDGWQRAMAAVEPVDAGTTRSGLPKRVPQAQLVPGGVQGGPRTQNRRTPDEVRGLLSAYHRGVQRGRTDGNAENAALEAKEKEQ